MAGQPPRISVIVPTYGRPAYLADALADIVGQELEADFEVVVVHRPEDPASERVARETVPAGRLRLATVREPGMVRALRVGLDRSRGEIVVFGDDDSRYPAGWLRRLESGFADPSSGAVGGPVVSRGETARRTRLPWISWYGRTFTRPGSRTPSEAHYLLGTNMAYRREAIDPDALDPALDGPGASPGNELALSFAARRRGFRVMFDPAIVVRHLAARADRDDRTPTDTEVYSRNVALLMRRGLSPIGRAGFVPYFWLVGQWRSPGLVVGIVGALTGRAPHRRWLRIALRGKREGWRLGAISRGPGGTPPPTPRARSSG